MQALGKLFLSIVILAVVVVGLGAAWYAVQDATGQLEIRQAEAEATRAQAQAERDRARADAARAQGERALAEAEGDAIRAPAMAAATAVRRQSFILTVWGLLAPVLLVLAAMVLVLMAILAGAMLVTALRGLGVGRYLHLRMRAHEAQFRDAMEGEDEQRNTES